MSATRELNAAVRRMRKAVEETAMRGEDNRAVGFIVLTVAYTVCLDILSRRCGMKAIDAARLTEELLGEIVQGRLAAQLRAGLPEESKQ